MKVVKFMLNKQDYAVDIGRIKEIIYFKKANPLPKAPPFVEGVVDLRGTVVPVIDLRKKMGMAISNESISDHILIIGIGNNLAGIIVDEVREVGQLNETEMQTPEKMHDASGKKYLKGIINDHDKMVYLLDLDAVLTNDERKTISEMGT